MMRWMYCVVLGCSTCDERISVHADCGRHELKGTAARTWAEVSRIEIVDGHWALHEMSEWQKKLTELRTSGLGPSRHIRIRSIFAD